MRWGKIDIRVWQVAVVVVAFAAHITLFLMTHDRWSAGVGYFILIPLITLAAMFGLRGGVLLGILAHPLNLVLWYVSGETIDSRFFQVNKLTAWAFALVIGVSIGYLKDLNNRYRQAVQGLAETNMQLSHALAETKTLGGLLPICSKCNKIRDDEGYWQLVEVYIEDRADVEFSHGLCPDCAKVLYPEIFVEGEKSA
jgi:hypothetical protein